MAERDRPHLFVPNSATPESYSKKRQRIESPHYPARSRKAHGERLTRELQAAAEAGRERHAAATTRVEGVNPGLYFTFSGFTEDALPLAVDSLSAKPAGIELLNVSEREEAVHAAVFVPDGKLGHFLSRLDAYMTEDTRGGEPKHKKLVESIASIRLATLQALWTDEVELFPEPNEHVWWELWLRRTDGEELERLSRFAETAELELLEGQALSFPDRLVVLAHASRETLAQSIDALNDMAEVRLAKETADQYIDMGSGERNQLARDLKERLQLPTSGDEPAVCLLDTGVNRVHPLLEDSLAAADLHTYQPAWGADDRRGHGTEMAGLALLGDLTPLLSTPGPVPVHHRLESVKILPNSGVNPPELYGYITEESAARAEVAAPTRRRVLSLAVGAADWRDRGRPSSWSAAIDQLAASPEEEDARRLFFISAGNLRGEPSPDHLAVSDTESVHDPGQAWNAVTVGAYTELIHIREEGLEDWQPVSESGELAPSSTTSLTWENQWPLKPEVVLEGGNAAKSPDGKRVDFPESLSLLTTHRDPDYKTFTATGDTSAACAQAARLGAEILAAYPSLWPETVRALIVHSAEWTAPMKSRIEGTSSKTSRGQLIRRYGYGVPDLPRALRSATNTLTLIAEEALTPFRDGKLGEMNLHSLPWPEEALRAIGTETCRLRVTLSYFVEPNPGRRGWKRKHQYASHGLRFAMKTSAESVEEFRRRINQEVEDAHGSKSDTASDANDWFLGPTLRARGSLHADIWTGSAEELANLGSIAVYPVSGWWKERSKEVKETRYSLIVSIDAPEVGVDLYTEVENLLRTPVAIER